MTSKLIVASVAAVATALAASSSPVGALKMRAGAAGMRRAASASKRVAPRVSAAAPRAMRMRIKRSTGVPSMEQPQLRGSGGRALDIARKNTRATFDQPEQQQHQQWRRDADDGDSAVEQHDLDGDASTGSDEVAQLSYMWVPDLPPKPQDQDQRDKGPSGEKNKKKSDVGLDIDEMLRSMLLQESGAKADLEVQPDTADVNRGAAIAAGVAAGAAGAALTAAAIEPRDRMNHAAAGSVPRSQIAFDDTIFDTYDSFSSYRGQGHHGDAFRNLLYPHANPSPANAELYPHVQQRSSWEQLMRPDAGRVADLDEILREQCEEDDEDVIDDSYC